MILVRIKETIMRCPFCGWKTCGCTWTEQVKAIKEKLVKDGDYTERYDDVVQKKVAEQDDKIKQLRTDVEYLRSRLRGIM